MGERAWGDYRLGVGLGIGGFLRVDLESWAILLWRAEGNRVWVWYFQFFVFQFQRNCLD